MMHLTLHSSMLPILKILSDGKEHSMMELVEKISDYFNLSAEERTNRTSSGQKRVRNIIGWARAELQAAGCVETPTMGYVKITERGLQVLKQNPDKITRGVLSQFPEFKEWMRKKSTKTTAITTPSKTVGPKPKVEAKPQVELVERATDVAKVQKIQAEAPEDKVLEKNIQEAYKAFSKNLSSKIAKKFLEISPLTFGKMIIDLLSKMGYVGSPNEASKGIERLGNDGIEVLFQADRLGFETIYIQARNRSIGKDIDIREIYRFEEVMKSKRAKKGIYIAPGIFTQSAIDYVWNREPKILLIDTEQLAELMIEHNIGVSITARYEIKKIDTGSFSEK